MSYKGEWLDGKNHGRGVETYVLRNGNKKVFDGQFEHGLRNGFGTLTERTSETDETISRMISDL